MAWPRPFASDSPWIWVRGKSSGEGGSLQAATATAKNERRLLISPINFSTGPAVAALVLSARPHHHHIPLKPPTSPRPTHHVFLSPSQAHLFMLFLVADSAIFTQWNSSPSSLPAMFLLLCLVYLFRILLQLSIETFILVHSCCVSTPIRRDVGYASLRIVYYQNNININQKSSEIPPIKSKISVKTKATQRHQN